ncbi:hypothetical protein [Sphingomonas sp. TREG-RG-20F-R18-01]|uniref:DUF7220 family protein n=1 Tax=Sphingomonas sp. TREG-RG-20F-R18-01 TaxID=2914982 RepID=UPI001F564690|nr:hypothetical protein [Sphingomonas sp. TREG-RG-20F-R18-01]
MKSDSRPLILQAGQRLTPEQYEAILQQYRDASKGINISGDYPRLSIVKPATQSRADSMMEAVTNTAIGYLITLLASAWIYPLFGIVLSFAAMNGVVMLFTIVSVARQYVLRRIFNGRTVWSAIRERFL